MTPKKFPWKATVQVRGSCDSQASPGSTKKNAHPNGPVGGIQDGSAWEASDGSGEAYGGSSSDFVSSGGGGVANNNSSSSSREGGGALWHEGSLTWTTAPFIQDDEVGKVVCSWSGVAEEVYPDEAGPRECDVTALAKEHAEGHLCLTIDMVTKPPLPPPPWTTPPFVVVCVDDDGDVAAVVAFFGVVVVVCGGGGDGYLCLSVRDEWGAFVSVGKWVMPSYLSCDQCNTGFSLIICFLFLICLGAPP